MDKTKNHEYEIVNEFNDTSFINLKAWAQIVIRAMFPDIKEDDVIRCDICNRYSKPDFYLEIKGKRKYVSLKSGRSDSIHFENIKSLILFFRKQGVAVSTQKAILYFHYGDETLNGSGKIRYGHADLVIKMKDVLANANHELNTKTIITECLERFVFSGIESRKIKVDYLLYGDKNYAIGVSKEELIDFVLSKGYRHIRTLHIGPMTIQPYLRDVDRKSKHPEKRDVVQIKWHYLLSDIERIKNN